LNDFDLVRVHMDTLATDNMAKKLYFSLEERALGERGVIFMETQKLKDLSEVVSVLFNRFAEDEDVIHVYGDKREMPKYYS
jgi:hypothetical protein